MTAPEESLDEKINSICDSIYFVGEQADDEYNKQLANNTIEVKKQVKALIHTETVKARIDELKHIRGSVAVDEQVLTSDGRHKRPGAEGRNVLKAKLRNTIDTRIAELSLTKDTKIHNESVGGNETHDIGGKTV